MSVHDMYADWQAERTELIGALEEIAKNSWDANSAAVARAILEKVRGKK